MKRTTRSWFSVLILTMACALAPTDGARAQPATGAPAPANPIDQLTAPIALYPDALVVQVLSASRNWDSLVSFSAWLEKNSNLKGSELQDAAQKAGFDVALVALAPFPQVIQTMVQQPDWTRALGQAVTADKKGVSDSIQRLRAQAVAMGNLKTTSQQKVETQTTSAGQQVVVIEPANPQVIYVPVYNTQTVYVQQAPPPPPPSSASSSANAAGAALVGFTVGVIIAESSHDHYYHDYDDYWEDRQDHAQGNQDERQSEHQANQDGRQSEQDERQTGRQENQDQRQSGGASAQSQSAPKASQGRSAAAPASRGAGASAAPRGSATKSAGGAGYQSGSATRAQSSRGSSSMSSSRSGGRGGRGR